MMISDDKLLFTYYRIHQFHDYHFQCAKNCANFNLNFIYTTRNNTEKYKLQMNSTEISTTALLYVCLNELL